LLDVIRFILEFRLLLWQK